MTVTVGIGKVPETTLHWVTWVSLGQPVPLHGPSEYRYGPEAINTPGRGGCGEIKRRAGLK